MKVFNFKSKNEKKESLKEALWREQEEMIQLRRYASARQRAIAIELDALQAPEN